MVTTGLTCAPLIPPATYTANVTAKPQPDRRGPTIGDVAGYLLLRHHSAVGLVDRAVAAGLVERRPDPDNVSAVRLRLTDEGARRLAQLSELHLEELCQLAPTMHALWDALDHGGEQEPHPAARPRPS